MGFDPDATLEDKVAFLRRNSESQKELTALAQRVAAIETEASERAAQLRAGLESHVARELAATKEDYRIARISGAIVLGFGLALTTAANFVS